MKTIAQIDAELQGYDPQALPADAVNAFLAELVSPVTQTERVPLFEALGRVLAEDIVSPISVPPHDNSAMDGFAFDGAQLVPGQPLALKIVGTALAGPAANILLALLSLILYKLWCYFLYPLLGINFTTGSAIAPVALLLQQSCGRRSPDALRR